ncbi:MAG: hypothetical protein JO280_13930 [Mycobacteriaceae bacterium]|nr:hypothetical protein [Mycobacteriaceae bacterium]
MTAQIPQAVPAATVSGWSDAVDVVVVGFGIAGGCMAVSAAASAVAGAVVDTKANVKRSQPAEEPAEVAVAKFSGGASFVFQPRKSLPLTVV